MHFDTSHHADAADISNHRMILKCEDRVEEVGFKVGRILEQPLALIDLLRGNAGSTGCRVRRIGIAMKEFDGVVRRGVSIFSSSGGM